QPVVTPLGTELPTPLELPVQKIICISSDLEAEDDDLEGLGSDGTTEEEEPNEEEAKEEADRPSSPKVEYVPYLLISAPRRSLVHPTQLYLHPKKESRWRDFGTSICVVG
ncbi:hypothetical protein PIB30_089968, partial [Stylosanthes scabra]|nr:hypothetical protein [Stylosanthes scabra]